MRFPFFSLILSVFVLSLATVTPTRAQADTTGSLEGRVVDSDTQQPVVGAIISMESIKEGQPPQRQRIGPTGKFRLSLIPGKGYYIQTEYYIRTEAAGYIPTKEKFIVSSGYATHINNKTIYLKKGNAVIPPEPPAAARTPVVTSPAATLPAQPKPVNASSGETAPMAATTTAASAQSKSVVTASTAPTTRATAASTAPIAVTPAATPTVPVTAERVRTNLQTVQFVQSKAELLPESQPALDQLLTFMRENPTINIELAGHTDNQGDYDKNLSLSKQRVELVKAFLVKNGIASKRISSRGYGSTRPIASNNSEETRRLNRRVEMIILTK